MSTNFYTGDHSATIQQAAKKAALLNPIKIKPRDSGTIKAALDNLKQRLADNTRQLSTAREHREELLKSQDELTKRVALLRAEGVHPSRLEQYLGYDFVGKNGLKTHHDGTLQILTGELERLDRRIATLAEGQKNLSAFCERELPALEAELAEAVRLERLGA